jgi:hypothetical protein
MTAPNDPWASAPAEPAQDPWGAAPAPAAPAVVSTPPYQGQANDGKFVVTLKGGSGFDAPWFVAHLDSLAEVEAALNDPTLKRILEKLQVIAPVFVALQQKSVGGAPAPAERRPAPAGAAGPPANAPACPGDGWVWRSGTVKAGPKQGEIWQGWMPPRGSSEKPVFMD